MALSCLAGGAGLSTAQLSRLFEKRRGPSMQTVRRGPARVDQSSGAHTRSPASAAGAQCFAGPAVTYARGVAAAKCRFRRRVDRGRSKIKPTGCTAQRAVPGLSGPPPQVDSAARERASRTASHHLLNQRSECDSHASRTASGVTLRCGTPRARTIALRGAINAPCADQKTAHPSTRILEARQRTLQPLAAQPAVRTTGEANRASQRLH